MSLRHRRDRAGQDVDHNISPYIARALAAIAEPDGHEVKAKSELFDTSEPVPDTE